MSAAQRCDVCGQELPGVGFLLTAIVAGDDGWTHEAQAVVDGGSCALIAISDPSAYLTPVGVVADELAPVEEPSADTPA